MGDAQSPAETGAKPDIRSLLKAKLESGAIGKALDTDPSKRTAANTPSATAEHAKITQEVTAVNTKAQELGLSESSSSAD